MIHLLLVPLILAATPAFQEQLGVATDMISRSRQMTSIILNENVTKPPAYNQQLADDIMATAREIQRAVSMARKASPEGLGAVVLALSDAVSRGEQLLASIPRLGGASTAPAWTPPLAPAPPAPPALNLEKVTANARIAVEVCKEFFSSLQHVSPQFHEKFGPKMQEVADLCRELEQRLSGAEMVSAEMLHAKVKFVTASLESATALRNGDAAFKKMRLHQTGRDSRFRFLAARQLLGLLHKKGLGDDLKSLVAAFERCQQARDTYNKYDPTGWSFDRSDNLLTSVIEECDRIFKATMAAVLDVATAEDIDDVVAIALEMGEGLFSTAAALGHPHYHPVSMTDAAPVVHRALLASARVKRSLLAFLSNPNSATLADLVAALEVVDEPVGGAIAGTAVATPVATASSSSLPAAVASVVANPVATPVATPVAQATTAEARPVRAEAVSASELLLKARAEYNELSTFAKLFGEKEPERATVLGETISAVDNALKASDPRGLRAALARLRDLMTASPATTAASASQTELAMSSAMDLLSNGHLSPEQSAVLQAAFDRVLANSGDAAAAKALRDAITAARTPSFAGLPDLVPTLTRSRRIPAGDLFRDEIPREMLHRAEEVYLDCVRQGIVKGRKDLTEAARRLRAAIDARIPESIIAELENATSAITGGAGLHRQPEFDLSAGFAGLSVAGSAELLQSQGWALLETLQTNSMSGEAAALQELLVAAMDDSKLNANLKQMIYEFEDKVKAISRTRSEIQGFGMDLVCRLSSAGLNDDAASLERLIVQALDQPSLVSKAHAEMVRCRALLQSSGSAAASVSAAALPDSPEDDDDAEAEESDEEEAAATAIQIPDASPEEVADVIATAQLILGSEEMEDFQGLASELELKVALFMSHQVVSGETLLAMKILLNRFNPDVYYPEVRILQEAREVIERLETLGMMHEAQELAKLVYAEKRNDPFLKTMIQFYKLKAQSKDKMSL